MDSMLTIPQSGRGSPAQGESTGHVEGKRQPAVGSLQIADWRLRTEDWMMRRHLSLSQVDEEYKLR